MTHDLNPRPPDLVAAKRDLAAARRRLRTLTNQLDATGGADLFAGDPSSVTARAAAARADVTQLEDLVATLRPGRPQLRLVQDTEPVVAADPERAAESTIPATADITVGEEVSVDVDQDAAAPAESGPAVAPLLEQWSSLNATASDPARPRGVGPLRVGVEAQLDDVVEAAQTLRDAQAALPKKSRKLLAGNIASAEQRWLEFREQRRSFDDPNNPATVAHQLWEAEHPELDTRAEAARDALDAAVSSWAAGPGRAFLPELPASVSEEGRQLWLDAAATQLAYRETYQVDGAEPLGAEPWDPQQVTRWNEARGKLAAVGVTVTSAAEQRLERDRAAEAEASREQGASRRSLNSVLSAVG